VCTLSFGIELKHLAYPNATIPNTPADDLWTLYIGYTPSGSVTGSLLAITFLPTGEIDNSTSAQNLTAANHLLAPTINLMREVTGDPAFDIYKYLNWLLVSLFWIMLYDLGQTAPTYYEFPRSGIVDLSSPVFYSSSNNVFVNDSLFKIYSSYLNNTIIPFLGKFNGGYVLPQFLPLNDSNTLEPTNMSFLRSYSCFQSQLKGGLSVTISVLVADYAFIAGAYTLVVFCAGWWHRKQPEGKYPQNQT
jgi:hypothetical protein